MLLCRFSIDEEPFEFVPRKLHCKISTYSYRAFQKKLNFISFLFCQFTSLMRPFISNFPPTHVLNLTIPSLPPPGFFFSLTHWFGLRMLIILQKINTLVSFLTVFSLKLLRRMRKCSSNVTSLNLNHV